MLLVLLRGMGPMWRWPELRRQAHSIHGFAWLMLGAGSNEVTGRLYSFVTVGRFGAEALALLSAVQVVIRPAWLLSSAWSSVGFPDMAQRWARGDRAGVIRAMAFGAGVTALGSLLWSMVVLLGWPWISGVIYHGSYADPGPLIYLWAANVVIGSVCVALNTGMLAVGEFRRLALIDLAGAIVTVAALSVTVATFSYPYAILATMLGQAASRAHGRVDAPPVAAPVSVPPPRCRVREAGAGRPAVAIRQFARSSAVNRNATTSVELLENRFDSVRLCTSSPTSSAMWNTAVGCAIRPVRPPAQPAPPGPPPGRRCRSCGTPPPAPHTARARRARQQVEVAVMRLVDDGVGAEPVIGLQAGLHRRIDRPERTIAGAQHRPLLDLADHEPHMSVLLVNVHSANGACGSAPVIPHQAR